MGGGYRDARRQECQRSSGGGTIAGVYENGLQIIPRLHFGAQKLFRRFPLFRIGQQLQNPLRGIIHERRKQHRPAGRAWTPRPPQAQSGRVHMPDGLLPRRLPVDVLERKRDLDELFAVGHGSNRGVNSHAEAVLKFGLEASAQDIKRRIRIQQIV